MTTAVIVPIKSFDLAKGRLADALSPADRAELARQLAARVLQAAGSLPLWVVCDDNEVADFADRHDANVLWRPANGLNPAVTAGAEFVGEAGFKRLIVAHADLPLATDLTWIDPPPKGVDVSIVTDRRGDGTNVMTLPTETGFRFQYGSGSAAAHQAEAQRLGLGVQVIHDDELGWDVDVPEDLTNVDWPDRPSPQTPSPQAPSPSTSHQANEGSSQ